MTGTDGGPSAGSGTSWRARTLDPRRAGPRRDLGDLGDRFPDRLRQTGSVEAQPGEDAVGLVLGDEGAWDAERDDRGCGAERAAAAQGLGQVGARTPLADPVLGGDHHVVAGRIGEHGPDPARRPPGHPRRSRRSRPSASATAASSAATSSLPTARMQAEPSPARTRRAP